MSALLPILGFVAVGAVLGVLGTRTVYRRSLISAGRAARAPVCNSCPFVTAEQRAEILTGRPTEAPPVAVLPMLDGSGMHRPVS